jgi:hypothetical protein
MLEGDWMQIARMAGLMLALASTLLGLYGLINAKPLPLSARLGAMASLDLNDDGRLTPDEWAKAGRTPAAMAALDTNHDNIIEPKEARRRQPRGGH